MTTPDWLANLKPGDEVGETIQALHAWADREIEAGRINDYGEPVAPKPKRAPKWDGWGRLIEWVEKTDG